MLENHKPEDRFSLILSYFYRIVGRVALIGAFILALYGDLKLAVASIAVALWMMWSAQSLFLTMIGQEVGSLNKESEK